MRMSKNQQRTDISNKFPRVTSNHKSKTPIFDLAIRKTNPIVNQKLVNNLKRDVAPRTDFAAVQKLVSNYLDKKRIRNKFEANKESNRYVSRDPSTYNHYTFKNKNVRNNFNAEQHISNNDFNLTNNFNLYDDTTVLNVDTDHKLMSLLDTLEQKIKDIELNTNEKELFDEKIRKIYLTLVGKSDFKDKLGILSNNQSKGDDINDYIKLASKRIRNDYFDSIRPEYSYRNINDNPTYDIDSNRNFSRNNWNQVGTIHPTFNLNVDDNENRARYIYDVRKKSQRNLLHGDYYLQNINDEDLMESDTGLNRRSYYDNKLAALRRKIDLMKRNDYQQKVRQDRKLRPVRPTKPAEEQKTYIKSKESMNNFYMPDRARFLHGF